jgi:hypothetical protein
MSRVGGGGYAEKRGGGVGDGTGGGMSGNGRDGRDGMGNRNGGFGGGMGGLNARRSVNPTPSYDMSLHNMRALSGMLPGPGMAINAAKMAMGLGPQFEGPRGTINGPGDYDGPNRFATLGSNINPGQRQGLNLAQTFRPKPTGAVKMPQQNPMMRRPGLQMNSGLQGYGTFRPGYSFIGGPF